MGWIEHAMGDVRHAWRMIGRMPGLAGVVVVSLGVGIGVNTTIFSWIQAMVFQPIPGVRDAAGFHLVEARGGAGGGTYPGASWLEYGDLRERLSSFRELIAFRMVPLTIGEKGRPERTYGQLVSANYFSGLGLTPAAGRFVQPTESGRGGPVPEVVISHGFWQTRFGGELSAVGQTVRVNDRPLTIVGVAPPGFQGTVLAIDFDMWVPATLAPMLLNGSRELEDRSQRGYTVFGRLRPRVTPAMAQTEVDRAMRELAHIYPSTNANVGAEIFPFWQAPRGPQRMLARALFILQGIMLLLLLAVCGNTANLMLARASVRQREMGVRRALGAGRGRVASLLLTENLMLALLGAALGAAIAVWGTNALRAVPFISTFPIRFQTQVDTAGLGFAVLLGIVCGLAFGVAPALQLSRIDPQHALRSGSSTTGRIGMRNGLMGVQVALALVVLMVAAFFFRSFRETRETDPGFRREGLLLAAYDLSGRNVDDATARGFTGRLLERLRALPGVEAAAIAASVPLDIHGLPVRPFTLEGRARDDAAQDEALRNTVTPGYFETMGIPVLAGSDFTELNDAATAPQVIVNEAFVRSYLEGVEPIGKWIGGGDRAYVIAGVVGNSLYNAFGEPPTPIIYYSYRDRPRASGEIHVRTHVGGEMPIAAGVLRMVRELDSSLAVYGVRTLSEHVEKNLFLRRIPARMFVVLGPLLLVLAAIGIYAVVAYTVARRTREIGVRLALGATARRVVGQIVQDTMRAVAFGAMAGWFIAFIVYIHAVPGGSFEASVFLGVPAVLMLVAAIASWLPAHRAARVDAMTALREE